jgi:FG-GAP-like repeat
MATRLLANGSEFQVNVNGGGGDGIIGPQNLPEAVALTDGRLAVAYQSPFQGDVNNTNIIVNVLGANSFLEPYDFPALQTRPALAAAAGGGFGLVFINELHANGSADANGPNVTYVPVTGGGAFGAALAIADFNGGAGHDAFSDVKIATLSTGRQVVVFERDFDSSNHDIFLNVVDASAIGTQFTASSPLGVETNASFQGSPEVAASGNQALVVYTDNTGNGSFNIIAKLFDGGSNTLGAAIPIADHTANVIAPSVAALSDNRYVITYTDGVDIFARIYDPSTPAGAFLSDEFLIDKAGGNANSPDVTGTVDGGFIVTWNQKSGGAGTEDVYARRFDAHGLAFGDEFVVNTFTDGGQPFPTVATSGSNVIIAWGDNGPRATDSSGRGIRAQEFTAAVFDYDSAGIGDLDGNGRVDILFQNDTGLIAVWRTNSAGQLSAITDFGPGPAGFKVFGTGNFNGTPGDDILLRSDAGSLAVLPTNGFAVGAHIVIGSTSADYHNAGIGDFTGDGQDDLLFRNDAGQIVTWAIANNGLSQAPQILGATSLAFHIVGIDDFTGDHQSDILFRNDDGSIALWQVAGNQLVNAPKVVGATSTAFHVVSTADFDGNGAKDILFRGDTGELVEWLLDSTGGLLSAPTSIGTVGAQYHVDGTGDLNGDGRDDIIFRDANGTVVQWLMNGTQFAAPPSVIGGIPVDFAIAAHHFDLV